MKMSSKSYNLIKSTFSSYLVSINPYATKLKATNDYTNFNTRLAWDCLNALMGSKWVCSLYKHEDLNDSHITTAAVKALKELQVI